MSDRPTADLDGQGRPLSDDSTRTTRPADREVRKAGVSQEITKEALDSAACDLRVPVKSYLIAKLREFTDGSVWSDEPVFEEFDTVRSVGIYADDADWDDEDNLPEPIGYKDIEIILIRASVHFAM